MEVNVKNHRLAFRHMFWECVETKRVWKSYNDYLMSIGHLQDMILDYKEIFNVGNNRMISMIKVRVIQEMIQIRLIQ